MRLIFCDNNTDHIHTHTHQMKASEISPATFDFCVFLIEIENRAKEKERENIVSRQTKGTLSNIHLTASVRTLRCLSIITKHTNTHKKRNIYLKFSRQFCTHTHTHTLTYMHTVTQMHTHIHTHTRSHTFKHMHSHKRILRDVHTAHLSNTKLYSVVNDSLFVKIWDVLCLRLKKSKTRLMGDDCAETSS